MLLVSSWSGSMTAEYLLVAHPSLKISTIRSRSSPDGFGHTDACILLPVCTTMRFFVSQLVLFFITIPFILTYKNCLGPGSINHGSDWQCFWKRWKHLILTTVSTSRKWDCTLHKIDRKEYNVLLKVKI